MELPIFPEERSCRSCGYLARLIRYSGRVEELPELPRRDGVFIHAGSVEARRENADKPVCFRRVCDLAGEWVESGRVAIERNRECPKWSAYRAGMTPQELWAEERMERLEEHRRAFEERMENARRAYDESERARDRLRNSRLRKWERRVDKKQTRVMVWITVLGIVISIAGVAAAVAALTKDSLIVQIWSPSKTP